MYKRAIFSLLALTLSYPLCSATIEVNSGSNSGVGTLREAITNANAGDTIVFNLPTSGGVADKIELSSGLPLIDKNLTIDGSTQLVGSVVITELSAAPKISIEKAKSFTSDSQKVSELASASIPPLRPFTIFSGEVNIRSITCEGTYARGGNAEGGVLLGSGGGGLGAGGAIFVNSGATVNATDVIFDDCYAKGGDTTVGRLSFNPTSEDTLAIGNGGTGGGGLGGKGGQIGSSPDFGGGGGGLFDDASGLTGGGTDQGGDGANASGPLDATAGQDFGGGGGGVYTSSPSTLFGKDGGFGGGGGGGSSGGDSSSPISQKNGGDGGFGGGGGGNGMTTTLLAGGIGNMAGNAGPSNTTAGGGGGGGSGFGGAIFVRSGGTINLTGATIQNSANTNIAGLGFVTTDPTNSGQDGLVAGDAIYVMENSTTSIGGTTSISSSISGAGGITIPTGASVTFSATNDYEGGTQVYGGLEGNTNSLQGDILVDGELYFNQSSDGTFVGNLMGTGAFRVNSSGTITFNTATDFTGNTTVEGGILNLSGDSPFSSSYLILESGTQLTLENDMQIGGINSAGTISIPGVALTIDQELDGAVLQAISGTAGSITKQGSANLRLAVENGYTGGTTITNGKLRLDHSSAISASESVSVQSPGILELITSSAINNLSGSGNVQLNSNDLTVINTVDTVHSGVISGTGSIIKLGVGDLSLTGDNTFSGSMTYSSGTVTGNSSSFSGNIINNASMVFQQDVDGSGSKIISISGTGAVTKQGSGSFTLNNDWTYSGATTISEGIFNLQGSLTNSSQTTVEQFAELQGVGTLGNLLNQGIVHPGNSIGTINVVGLYTQASGSILDIEIDDAGNASLVNVTGNVVIKSNAALRITPQPGNYVEGLEYVVISSTAGVAGSFDNLYLNNFEELDGVGFSINTSNPNQVLFQLLAAGGNPSPTFASDAANPGPILMNALTVQGVLLSDSFLSSQLDWEIWYDPSSCVREVCCFRPFLAVEYQQGDYKSENYSLKSDFSLWGIYCGGDILLSDSFLLGFVGGYQGGCIDSTTQASDTDSDSAVVSVYVQKDWCHHKWTLDGYLSTMWSWYDAKRDLDGSISGESNGGSFTGKLRFTYDWDCFSCLHIQPQVGLIGNYFQVCGYSEKSTLSDRRKYDRGTADLLAIEPALRIYYNWACTTFSIAPEVKVGYAYDFLDSKTKVEALVIDDSSEKGTVKLDNTNENQVYLRAGFSLGIFNSLTAGGFYQGTLYGNRFTTNGWSLYFKASF